MTAQRTTIALFGLGLLLRVALLLLAVPWTHQAWFVPFLRAAPGLLPDPWSGFLLAGGAAVAFPYGLPYLIAFAPPVALGDLLGGAAGGHLGLGFGVLICELALIRLIALLGGAHGHAAAMLYWLSPVAIYVGYWHGQLDALPTALLVAALLAVACREHRAGGLWLGVSIAAKFSMAAALPFVALYYLGRARLRAAAPWVLGLTALSLGVTLLPLLASPGYRSMVLLTPEMQKAYSVSLDFGAGLALYLLPLSYLVLLYWAWRVRRLDFDLLCNFIAMAFMAILLLTPASPGWAIWALPFVALHVARCGGIAQLLYWPFALAFVALHLINSTGAVFAGVDLTAPLGRSLPGRVPSILMTVMFAAGSALTLQIARRGILTSPFYRASRKPFAVAVAGDSGSGKDTLIDALVAMFGGASVARVSGDDYHIWDRQKPMWRALTHLNPMANDLETFAAHVTDLGDGKPVRARHYDHATGRNSEPLTIAPREVLAVSGLHALWSPALAARFDVRVFMDMAEPLRRFLKLRRDVGVRGQAPETVIESMDRRAADGARFIAPQAAAADIVFRLEPRHPSAIADPARDLDTSLLRLVVTLGAGRKFEHVARVLVALCGMQAIETPLADGRTQVTIEGEPTAADIAAAARRLCPEMREFLAVEPEWCAGLSGVMQLIVLTEFDRSRRRRGLAA